MSPNAAWWPTAAPPASSLHIGLQPQPSVRQHQQQHPATSVAVAGSMHISEAPRASATPPRSAGRVPGVAANGAGAARPPGLPDLRPVTPTPPRTPASMADLGSIIGTGLCCESGTPTVVAQKNGSAPGLVRRPLDDSRVLRSAPRFTQGRTPLRTHGCRTPPPGGAPPNWPASFAACAPPGALTVTAVPVTPVASLGAAEVAPSTSWSSTQADVSAPLVAATVAAARQRLSEAVVKRAATAELQQMSEPSAAPLGPRPPSATGMTANAADMATAEVAALAGDADLELLASAADAGAQEAPAVAAALGMPPFTDAKPPAVQGGGFVPVAPAGAALELVVMTLNLQYFCSYPADEIAARDRLFDATAGPNAPDVICVQEGLKSRDVLRDVGYEKCICSAEQQIAQSVSDMVYGDQAALSSCRENSHMDFLCNQIYVRPDGPWEVVDQGAVCISSNKWLDGGFGRAQGQLAIRSMVWVKLRRKGGGVMTPVNGSSHRHNRTPMVYVMCTHISGGRFEDQYFLQDLSQERFDQPARIISWFERSRPNPNADDVGILVGDFNATETYLPGGPMQGYFKAAIAKSPGVVEDAATAKLHPDDLEEHFKAYMISPFKAIRDSHNWVFAYDDKQVGASSAFGHLVDHMATNREVEVKSPEVFFLTNQKFSKHQDTQLPITDHNSVKAIFVIR